MLPTGLPCLSVPTCVPLRVDSRASGRPRTPAFGELGSVPASAPSFLLLERIPGHKPEEPSSSRGRLGDQSIRVSSDTCQAARRPTQVHVPITHTTCSAHSTHTACTRT